MKADKLSLQVRVSLDSQTGSVLAVYFRVREGKSAECREYADGKAVADYNAAGKLLGIEILAPCEVAVIDQISRGQPAPVKTMMRGSIPAQMLLAS